MLFNNIVDSIGNTPLVKLNGTDENSAEIYVKLESRNPSGSVKDRPVKYIVKEMFDKGVIEKGSTIIEATSGNTGIGLAMIGAALDLNVVLVMPDTMSTERRSLLKAYGAELVLTPGAGGMKEAVAKAEEIAKEKDAPILGQFDQMANVTSHEETTAEEILKDLPDIDGFVAGIGTGGTVSGVGNVLKDKLDAVTIWSAEPAASPILTEGKAAGHKIQGLGANFIPSIYNKKDVVDKVTTVTNEEAIEAMKALAKEHGILAGISSGSNFVSAKALAKELGKGKKVVTVLPDTGERYLSTGFFDGE